MSPLTPKPVSTALAALGRRPPAFSFGIPRLDRRVGAVGPGDLVVVTTNGIAATGPFLAFVALEAARRDVPTLYVEDVVAERTKALYWLAAATKRDAIDLRDVGLPEREPAVVDALTDLAARPLYYADSAGRSLEDLDALVTAMPSAPGLVVVELATSTDFGAAAVVGSSLRALRRLAVARDCVVLASVAAWGHGDGEVERLPQFGADPTARLLPTVLLQFDQQDRADERRILVHLTRTRGGEAGFVPLTYDRDTGRFDEWPYSTRARA